MSNSSPGPSTRGRVTEMVRGEVTLTVFSAVPYAFFSPATVITRTAPTYWGRSILWVRFWRGPRRKGP